MLVNRLRLLGCLALLGLPTVAQAHAFGQLYSLPVPSWLFIYGGAAAVAVSFIVISIFVNHQGGSQPIREMDVSYWWIVRFFRQVAVQRLIKAASLGIFLLFITTGLFGNTEAYANFSPTFFWIIFFLGMTYVVAILGNIWRTLNPYQIVLDGWERITRVHLTGYFSYQPRWKYFPAFIFYLVLIWLEILSSGWASVPRNLGLLTILYTMLTFMGVMAFGKETWLRYGDFFSVFFRLIGKVSPIQPRAGRIMLRAPFVSLLEDRAENATQVWLIIFMLASTAFDGFRATLVWQTIRNAWQPVNDQGYFIHTGTYEIVMLFLMLGIFVGLYYFAMWALKLLTHSSESVDHLAKIYALTLLPIALVYHVAHYYTLLLISGQSIMAFISDPYGIGWNVFGTRWFAPNVGLLGASFIWYSQVAFILIGHIASVYLAHRLAVQQHPNRSAIIGQLPMLVLMVLYTMLGLWILSEPLRVGG